MNFTLEISASPALLEVLQSLAASFANHSVVSESATTKVPDPVTTKTDLIRMMRLIVTKFNSQNPNRFDVRNVDLGICILGFVTWIFLNALIYPICSLIMHSQHHLTF